MFSSPTTFARQLETVGVALPAEATAALTTLATLRETTDAQPAASLPDMATLTPKNAAQLLTEHAQRLNTLEKMATALPQFEGIAVNQFRTTIRDNADKLLIGLRTPFDEAASVVQVAGRHFPPGASDSHVLAAGPDAAAAWHQLGAALATLDTIRSIRVQIGDLAGHGEQRPEWYIDGASDATALEAAHRAYYATGNAFHGLAAAGFTLRLNTEAEATQVAAHARQVSNDREAAEREQALAAHREEWAPFLAAAIAAQ